MTSQEMLTRHVTMREAHMLAAEAAALILENRSDRVVLHGISPGGVASALAIASAMRELSRGSCHVDVVDQPRPEDEGLTVQVFEVAPWPNSSLRVALIDEVDPVLTHAFPWTASPKQRPADLVRSMLTHVGEDPDREGLVETPSRVVKAWDAWFSGYHQDPADVLKVFRDGAEGVDEMVLETDIPVYSFCEHHMAPIFGVAHVAYIPDGHVVGLSKLVRVVDLFARRLQVQERLTNQVADALFENLDAMGVGVVLQCRHFCLESRGVCRSGVVTTTSALRGAIKHENAARAEFLDLIKMAKSTHNAIL